MSNFLPSIRIHVSFSSGSERKNEIESRCVPISPIPLPLFLSPWRRDGGWRHQGSPVYWIKSHDLLYDGKIREKRENEEGAYKNKGREREFRISTFFPRLRIESGLIREWKRGSDFARVSLVDSNISRLLAFPVGTETTQASYFTRTYPRVDDASRRLSRFSLSLLRRDSLRNSLSLSPFLPFSLSLPRSRPLSLARERGMEKTLTEIFYRRTVSKQRRIVNRFDGHLDGIINEWRNDASAPLGRGPVYLAWDSVANRRSLGSRFVDRVGDRRVGEGWKNGWDKKNSPNDLTTCLYFRPYLPTCFSFPTHSAIKGLTRTNERVNWNKRIEVDDRCFSRLILPSPRLIDRVAIVPSREREREREERCFAREKKRREEKRKQNDPRYLNLLFPGGYEGGEERVRSFVRR